MALNVRGYQYVVRDQHGETISAGHEPSIWGMQVTVGQESDAFPGNCNFLRLHAEEDVRLEFGEAPSASSSSTFRMVAGQTEFIGVKPGHKLDTATG